MSELAPAKPQLAKALTGNRLQDGEVVFWGRGHWREQFSEIELFDDPAEAEAVLARAQAQPTVIVDPYLIDVRVEDGLPVPIAFRERVRALGPTIHPDMGKQTEGGRVVDAIAHAAGAARSAGRVNLIRRK
jgi:sulfite reductase (NADPH) hemoprotein beta-component